MSAVDLQELFLERSAPYWQENLDMRAIFLAQATELTGVEERLTQYLINEHFIESASDWGLKLLEYKYGLLDDVQRTLEERRGRLRAAKRGGRSATIANMELVASGFVGGEVEITPDYDNFVMTVEFVDILGVPTRISDVQAEHSLASSTRIATTRTTTSRQRMRRMTNWSQAGSCTAKF